MLVEVHTTFRHDCSEFPEGYDRPGTFASGHQYDVPDKLGDYFIRAGWASEPGEQPLDVPKNTVVEVEAHDSHVAAKAAGAKTTKKKRK